MPLMVAILLGKACAWYRSNITPVLYTVQLGPTDQVHGLLLNRRKSSVSLIRYVPPEREEIGARADPMTRRWF